MRFKDVSHLKPKSYPAEYVDTVSYNGHAMLKFMNRDILERMRASERMTGNEPFCPNYTKKPRYNFLAMQLM